MIYVNQPIDVLDDSSSAYRVRDDKNLAYVSRSSLNHAIIRLTLPSDGLFDQSNMTFVAEQLQAFGTTYLVSERYRLQPVPDDEHSEFESDVSALAYAMSSLTSQVYVDVPDNFATNVTTALNNATAEIASHEKVVLRLYTLIALSDVNRYDEPTQDSLLSAISQTDAPLNFPEFAYWLRNQSVKPTVIDNRFVRNPHKLLQPLSDNKFMRQVAYTAQRWVNFPESEYLLETSSSVYFGNLDRIKGSLSVIGQSQSVDCFVSVIMDERHMTVDEMLRQLENVMVDDFFLTVYKHGRFLELHAQQVDFMSRDTTIYLPYNYLMYTLQGSNTMTLPIISPHNEYQRRPVKLLFNRSFLDTPSDYVPSRYESGLVPAELSVNTTVSSIDASDELVNIIKNIH
jgi:hypothetical protein